MALDFHLGSCEEEASRTLPVFSMELSVHQSIFGRIGNPEGEVKLFYRLFDYWADASFEVNELLGLIGDSKQLAQEFLRNDETATMLASLIKLCEEGIKSKQRIWVFCD